MHVGTAPPIAWEYCSISARDNLITYCTLRGEVKEAFEDLFCTLATLGGQGWEMVAINSVNTIYFKRPTAAPTAHPHQPAHDHVASPAPPPSMD